jgi:hypothetical protein
MPCTCDYAPLCTRCTREWAHTCALAIHGEAAHWGCSLDEVSAQHDVEDARMEAEWTAQEADGIPT